MAVNSTKLQSYLTLKYKEGVDSKGNDIIKSQKFAKVKTDSTDADVYDTAALLGNLLKYPLMSVIREDDSTLTSI